MKQKGFGPIIVVIAVAALLGLAGVVYIFGLNKDSFQALKFPVTNLTTSPSPAGPLPTHSPTPSSDEIGKWKTFTSTAHGFSFKYDPSWIVHSAQANNNPNGFLELAKDNGRFLVYANMVGIGGVGRDYEGTPVSLNGTDLYRYKVLGADGKTTILGLTDRLSQSLGVFQRNGKTYSITLVYLTGSKNAAELDHVFDLMLSTFSWSTPDKSADTPRVSSPKANSKISSPLTISGKVPAGWMFEGVFPITLTDEKKNVIVQGQGKEVVPGSWQSGKEVEFTATLSFTTDAQSGFLVLQNDNPSGNPENSKTFEIPVTF